MAGERQNYKSKSSTTATAPTDATRNINGQLRTAATSAATAAAPANATQTSELWVRVESRSRPGRFYWTTTDGLRSQWTRPAARKIVPPTNVAGNLGKLPGDALNLILADYCDPAAAARAAAASRGGYTAAAAPKAWLARLGLTPPAGKDPLALFAKPSLRRDAPRIMCCDARGRELFAARRLEELDAQERPDEAARACFEKLRRDECTRNLVADGALTVAELVECARRYADKAALGSDPKSLSPRSAGRHTSVVRHVLLADDEIDALLAKRSPAMARLRRREALSALDALGPAPTRLSLLTIEAAKPDALAFAAYHAEQLRKCCERFRGVRDPRALVRATLDLSPALRGRVAVGRLPLEDACRYTAADRARAEQALQRKRTAMRLEDFSRKRFRPAAVAAARPVPVLGAF